MSSTYNPYEKIFRKLKSIFEADQRTSFMKVYGVEYAKKKTMPCIAVFPEAKNWATQSSMREARKSGLPKLTWYDFSIWVFNELKEYSDGYYNTSLDSKSGITQMMTEVEAVLIANHTGTDPDDSSVRLWDDMMFNKIEISTRPGKLMFGRILVSLRRKELE